jgi:hypothetical protein
MDCILSQMKHMQCPFMSHKHHSKVYWTYSLFQTHRRFM